MTLASLAMGAMIALAACKAHSEAPQAHAGSSQPAREDAVTQADTPTNRVARTLERHTIAELTAADSPVADELVHGAGAIAALHELAGDAGRGRELRFKAYEVLNALGGGLRDAGEKRAAAEVYARELAEGRTHNDWGLPDGTLDETARRLLALGKDAAVPALAPLLTSARPLVYVGSQEPTMAKHYGWRVADLAGRLVADLVGARLDAHELDLGRRDQALRELAEKAR